MEEDNVNEEDPVQQLTLEEVKTRLSSISKQACELRIKMIIQLNKTYVLLENPLLYIKISTDLLAEVKNIKDSITQSKCNQFDQYIENQLSDSEICLQNVNSLCEINNGLLKLQQLRKEESFVEVIQEIVGLKFFQNLLESNVSDMQDIYMKLSTKIYVEESRAVNKFITTLQKNFKFAVNTCNNKLCNSIVISKSGLSVSEACKAAYIYDGLLSSLQDFIKFIWQNIFCEIIKYKTCSEIKSDTTFMTYELTIDKDKKDSYSVVFMRIVEFCQFLEANLKHKLNEDIDLLQHVMSDMRNDLVEVIIKYCFDDIVPNNKEELEKYEEVSVTIIIL